MRAFADDINEGALELFVAVLDKPLDEGEDDEDDEDEDEEGEEGEEGEDEDDDDEEDGEEDEEVSSLVRTLNPNPSPLR